MTTPAFPTLPSGKTADSAKYGFTMIDPSMSTDMEGGYSVSRARHTRKPLRSFTSGFTDITGADKLVLENFFDTVRGGSMIFSWQNPEDSQTYMVRFKNGMSFKYAGYGQTRRWDCVFEVKQA